MPNRAVYWLMPQSLLITRYFRKNFAGWVRDKVTDTHSYINTTSSSVIKLCADRFGNNYYCGSNILGRDYNTCTARNTNEFFFQYLQRIRYGDYFMRGKL